MVGKANFERWGDHEDEFLLNLTEKYIHGDFARLPTSLSERLSTQTDIRP